MHRGWGFLFVALLTSCKPAAPAATTANTGEAPAAGEEESSMGGKWADEWDAGPGGVSESGLISIPTACAELPKTADGGVDSLCVPGDAYTKKVCSAAHPDHALALFVKGSPFTRMYLRGDVDGWNAEGGASTRAKLVFDEEIVVLRKRTQPQNSIVLGSGASYQVMRWDGACYTLDGGELTKNRPPTVKHPGIPWKRLSERTKDVLLKNAKVQAAFEKRGKECKGASSGEVPKPCEAADTALSATIVSEVRGGLAVPVEGI